MADHNPETQRAPYPGATPIQNLSWADDGDNSSAFFSDLGGDDTLRTHPSPAHTHSPATPGVGHQSQRTSTPATQGAGQQGQHNYQRAMPAPGQQGYYQQVPPVRTEQYGAGLGHSTQAPPMMRPGQFGPMPSPGQVIEHMNRSLLAVQHQNQQYMRQWQSMLQQQLDQQQQRLDQRLESQFSKLAEHTEDRIDGNARESAIRQKHLEEKMDTCISALGDTVSLDPEATPGGTVPAESETRTLPLSILKVDSRRETLPGISDSVLAKSGGIPKMLTNGESLTSKFNNLASEDILRVITNIEYELKLVDSQFWSHLVVQKVFGAKVKATVVQHGQTLMAGRHTEISDRGVEVPCGPNWNKWSELREFLVTKYYRPHTELKKLEKMIYTLSQGNNSSLEQYINEFESLLATCRNKISDDQKKAIFLHNMRPATRHRLLENPELLDMEYEDFKTNACTLDDSMFRAQKTNAAPRRQAALNKEEKPVSEVAATTTERKNDALTAEGKAALIQRNCPKDLCYWCKWRKDGGRGAHMHAIYDCPNLHKKRYPNKPLTGDFLKAQERMDAHDNKSISALSICPLGVDASIFSEQEIAEIVADSSCFGPITEEDICNICAASSASSDRLEAYTEEHPDAHYQEFCEFEEKARPPGEQKPAFVFGPRAADPDAPPAPKTASKTVKRKVETEGFSPAVAEARMEIKMSYAPMASKEDRYKISKKWKNKFEKEQVMEQLVKEGAVVRVVPGSAASQATDAAVEPEPNEEVESEPLVESELEPGEPQPTAMAAIVCSKEEREEYLVLERARVNDIRVIINAEFEGVKIRCLLDSGSQDEAVDLNWVNENRAKLTPFLESKTQVKATGIVEGGGTLSSKEDLRGYLCSGEYGEEMRISVYSGMRDTNYDMILGRKWHARVRHVEDYDASVFEDSVLVRPRQDGKMAVIIKSNRQMLPHKKEGVDIEAGVYKVAALNSATLDQGSNQLDEIEFASHKKYKKINKRALNEQRKQEKFEKKKVGGAFMRTAFACLLTCAALSTYGREDTATYVSQAVVSVVSGLSAVAYAVGQATMATAATYGGVPPAEIRKLDIRKLSEIQVQDYTEPGEKWTCTPEKNPFLPPNQEILGQVNKTMPSMENELAAFLKQPWRCTKELPHKRDVHRAPQDTMSIHFKPGFENFIPRPRRYKTPKHLLPVLKQCLTELAEKGIIKPSKSPFSSGCSLVVKPHQEGVPPDKLKYRLVVDLREINNVTVPLHHKIPDISSIWNNLSEARVISVLDLAHGFFQENLNVEDGSAAKTAFSTEYGHWEFVGCVMGAKNTPAFFQSRVEDALRAADLLDVGLLRVNPETGQVSELKNTPCCTPYIDDLLVYSKNPGNHFDDLKRVFQCLSDRQYHIRPEKCHFCCKYALFCGGIVGNGILAMDPLKIEAINNWEKPTNITELRSFLGTCNYLKPWMKNYSQYSGVLTDLTKKGKCVKNDWNVDCDKAFANLKHGFKTYPVLRMPDFNKQFYLVTDSCDHALGGMVGQMYERDGKKVILPVAYHSRKFNKHERNYPVREQECLAIHDSFKKFEYLLRGAKFEVIIETDHSSLRQVQLGGDIQSNKRLSRWAEYLGGYAYNITWIPGSKNLIGDGISRSITATSGTEPVPGEGLRLPQIAPVTWLGGDPRIDHLNYSDSKEFKDTYNKLLQGESDIHLHPEIRHFELIGRRLYYKLSDGSLAICIPEGHRFYTVSEENKTKIPFREALLRECHNSPYMGHRGVNKTYAQMRKLFYWKSLHRDVRRFVGTCSTCMRAKASTRGEVLPIRGKECPAGPMYSVTMDFIAGLPPVKHKNFPGREITSAVVLVDRFSKKVFIEPTPVDITSEETAALLQEKIFMEHGWPLELITDRDSKFTAKFWKGLLEAVGTQLKLGYAYHQRFDGQTESLNRVIKEIMRCYIDLKQENWLEQCPYVASSINNSLHTETGYTPNEIYYSRRLLRPIEQQFSLIKDFKSVEEFLEDSLHKRWVAEEVIRQGVTRYVKQFNRKLPLTVIDPRIKPGSLVFVDAKNIKQPNLTNRPSRKLDPKRVGPFKVVRTVGTTGFELEMPGYPHHNQFHAHSLTPFEEGTDFELRSALKQPDHVAQDTGIEKWVVKELAARKKYYRKWYYFVVYEGYGVEEGEWELRSDLLNDCPRLIAEFEKRDPLPPNSGVVQTTPGLASPEPQASRSPEPKTKNNTLVPRRNPRRAATRVSVSASTGNGVDMTP